MIDTLIIKPTSVCQFKCSFCSSPKLSESSSDYLDLKYIFDFLDRFPSVHSIVVNGGDPLCMSPDYYWKIIEFIKEKNLPARFSCTSNLWDFFKRPDKWTDLFNSGYFFVNTSFQYDIKGHGRLKPDFTNFNEDDFWRVSDLFAEKIGYRPDFISVVTDENKHLALKNVELAQKMSNYKIPTSFNSGEKIGVECKLNYVMKSGPTRIFKDKHGKAIKQGAEESNFIMADIYKIYVDIHKAGLSPWEHSTKEMSKIIKDNGLSTVCPLSRKCDYSIRVLQPTTNKLKNTESIDNRYYTCGAFGDDLDKVSAIDYNKEIYNKEFFAPLQEASHLNTLKKACYSCLMFQICCSCRKTTSDFKKKGGQIIEQHCKQMKQLAPEILKINGFSEEEIKLKITPYKQEYFN